jgi:glycosyltransferase involved in cell wall biosynthesis
MEHCIEETIETILAQTYKGFELIVVDDGSVDTTIERINKFNDSRIKIHKLNNNYGVGYALNEGVKLCDGKYIAKVDGDDLYDQHRFEKQVYFLENNPQISIVGSRVEYFPNDKQTESSLKYINRKKFLEDYENHIYTTDQLKQYLYKWDCIQHTSIMFRREVFNEISYRPKRIYEDYDLYYRLNQSGYQFYKISEVLVKMRVSNSSTTSIERDSIHTELLDIKQEHIRQLFREEQGVYIWGASNFGQNVCKILIEQGFKIRGFIDSDINKQLQKIEGLKVFAPDEILKKHAKLLITSTPGRESIQKILDEFQYIQLQDYIMF